MKKVLYLSLLVVVLVSCTSEKKSPTSKVDFEGISETIKPGDNFFGYVNKTWLDEAVIADDEAGVGSYSFLNIPQKKLLENILTEVSAETHEVGTIEQMVGDFYAYGMDIESINNRGYEPLQPTFNKIDAINSVASLMAFVTDEMRSGNGSIIGMYVSPDD